MKKITIICCFLGLITNILLSQIPDGFSYQAVIRDSDNSLLKNQTVTVEASILRNEEVIFTQIIEGKTNENGLLSLTIGGTPDFGEIDWTEGQLFIQTRIDPMGGSDFRIETTSQLMSVPYAMAVKTAMNVAGLDLLKEKVNKLEEQVEELHNIVYPIIPFEEYSLEGTLCQWISFLQFEIRVINSYEELENNINCSNVYPFIDFENFSLIFSTGMAPSSPAEIINKQLRQYSDNGYYLILNVRPGPITTPARWYFAAIVSKLPQNVVVELVLK